MGTTSSYACRYPGAENSRAWEERGGRPVGAKRGRPRAGIYHERGLRATDRAIAYESGKNLAFRSETPEGSCRLRPARSHGVAASRGLTSEANLPATLPPAPFRGTYRHGKCVRAQVGQHLGPERCIISMRVNLAGFDGHWARDWFAGAGARRGRPGAIPGLRVPRGGLLRRSRPGSARCRGEKNVFVEARPASMRHWTAGVTP